MERCKFCWVFWLRSHSSSACRLLNSCWRGLGNKMDLPIVFNFLASVWLFFFVCVFFCCTKARDLQRLYYQDGCAEELSWHLSFAEADLGKAPLFGVKKEEITEGRKAGRASKAKPSKKRSRERKEKGNCRYKCYESYRSRVGPSTPFYPDVFFF